VSAAAYYNENDPFAAEWLRKLIAAGHIADGTVDERDIKDVRADDLDSYTQAHFFAGIGGWSRALRLAGWPDDRPVWTGSCPCQPFSGAGQRRSITDERHLWPEFCRLIAECGPAIVFGEQVASKDGRFWLAGVRDDLEALAYGVGAADLCAAGVGAPHIRQRLYWVADAVRPGWPERRPRAGERPAAGSGGAGGLADTDQAGQRELWCSGLPEDGDAPQRHDADGCRTHGGLANAEHAERWPQRQADSDAHGRDGLGRRGDLSGLGDTDEPRSQGRGEHIGEHADQQSVGAPGLSSWSDFDWLPCTDGKARRIEPGSFPLAHGVPARMGRLRGYGNAIVPQVAAEFIRAFAGIGAVR
jgi:DNA (cytosine-5)-methyltransferase 1